GAAFDIHAAVGALGHDLQGLVFAAHDPKAHESKARLFNDGLENRFQMGRNGKDIKLQSFSPAAVFTTATQPDLVVWDWRVFTLKRDSVQPPPLSCAARKRGSRGCAS